MAGAAGQSEAVKSIMKDIPVLTKVGVPGTCWIGSNSSAEVILTGDGKDEVLIVAGKLGKGRILAISHSGYLDNFIGTPDEKPGIKQLHKNIKTWLSKGTYKSDKDVMWLEKTVVPSEMKQAKVLCSTGGNVSNQRAVEKQVIHFVKAGGGFVLASCPWGYLQVCPGKTINDLPFYSVLAEIGVGFNTKSYIHGCKGGFQTACSKTTPVKGPTQPAAPEKKAGKAQLKPAAVSSSPRDAILNNVSVLDMQGGIPGRVVVYGDKTEAILTGPKPCDVIIAAGTLGLGRVIVISHNGIMNGFNGEKQIPVNSSLLLNNIKMWVSDNRYSGNNDELCDLSATNAQNIDSKIPEGTLRILFWRGGNWDESIADRIEESIINGNGCVLAMCPWGWLSLNSGKVLADVPFYNIMKAVGVCYTDDYCNGPFCPDANQADIGHCLRSLRCVASDLENASSQNFSALKYLSSIPQREKEAHVIPLVTHLEQHFMSNIHHILPSERSPVRDDGGKGKFMLMETIMKTKWGDSYKYAGAADFPGDIAGGLPPNYKLCVSVEVESHTEDVHPTGYYVLPGETLKVQAANYHDDFKSWTVMIGAHKDKLYNCSQIKRHPDVVVSSSLKTKDVSLSTPYGGLVYLISPRSKASTIQIWLKNVIESPYYNIMDGRTVADWHRRKSAPGLWADMSGEFVTITLPSESVRNIEDPLAAMENWDRVIRAHFHLKGADLRKHRRQWFVTDRQPSVGYMHSGYPIVTHLDVAQPSNKGFVLDANVFLREGHWGLYHEVGHNMQDQSWTFKGTVEVTCNIFTLHAMEMISKRPVWIHDWLRGQIPNTEKYLKGGRNFSQWQSDPGAALFIYAQLIHNFGWEPFRKVFRSYIGAPAPSDLQDKIDMFFCKMSDAVGYSLAALLDFWGVPLSSQGAAAMSGKPFFLPDDEITRKVPHIVQSVMNKFPNTVRHVPTPSPNTEYPENLGPPLVQPPMVRIKGVTTMTH